MARLVRSDDYPTDLTFMTRTDEKAAGPAREPDGAEGYQPQPFWSRRTDLILEEGLSRQAFAHL